jgi:hypothetical protein
MDIIKDASKLNQYISATLKAYGEAGRKAHIAVISCLWHVSTHGDVRPLNAFFAGLRTNDQQAVRLYVRRCQIINGLGGKDINKAMPSDVLNSAAEAGAILSFSKSEFHVVKNPNTDQAKIMVGLCETRFINPDGKKDMYVLDRNNFAEVATIGDTDLLKRVKALKTQLTTTDTRDVHVSDKVRDLIVDFADKAEAMLSQFNLANDEPAKTKTTAPAIKANAA